MSIIPLETMSMTAGSPSVRVNNPSDFEDLDCSSDSAVPSDLHHYKKGSFGQSKRECLDYQHPSLDEETTCLGRTPPTEAIIACPVSMIKPGAWI